VKIPAPLLTIARRLGPVRVRVVFVGGMIRGLLLTDPAASAPRPTDDVDLILDVPSRAAYFQLGEDLRTLGFQEAMHDEDAPICRWIVDGVRTDIMPVDPSILGFTNVWYKGAADHARTAAGPDGNFRYLDGPHFCATKLEAFASRGGDDFYHHDLEDFIALVDGRPSLADEIEGAPSELRAFIVETVSDLLASAAFRECLPGHLEGDDASQRRLPLLLRRLNQIAGIQTGAKRSSLPMMVPQVGTMVPRPGRPPSLGTTSASRNAPWVSPQGRVPLRSTNLAAVEYDHTSSSLIVEFHSGRIYRYAGVTPAVYDGLLRAYSHGRYFHGWIKNRYPSSRIR
jgi:hypothetical protein